MAIFKVKHKQDPRYFTPKYHDEDALEDVIGYCLNPASAPHYIGGLGVSVNQAAFEMSLLAQSFEKANGVKLRHFILSFSEDEVTGFQDRAYEVLNEIAWCTIKYYGNEYQIIFAVHENCPSHPHIHFVMNSVNFKTGRKYGGKKEDYYRFQNYLKSLLWNQYGLRLEVVADHG